MQKQPILPVAYLSGVIENPGEHAACSLVFQFETDTGKVLSWRCKTGTDGFSFCHCDFACCQGRASRSPRTRPASET